MLACIRAAADRHGLLITDEIFTGFARTGTMFACEQAAVVPDIMTLSKALTGGHAPLSAAIARRHVFAAFLVDDPERALMHGPAYKAHPVACAAASASLDLFENEHRLADVQRIAAQMRAELLPLAGRAGVREVRVKGAIAAVELAADVAFDRERACRAFVEEGVWIRPLERMIYLTPPLVIAPDELSRLSAAIVRLVDRLRPARRGEVTEGGR